MKVEMLMLKEPPWFQCGCLDSWVGEGKEQQLSARGKVGMVSVMGKRPDGISEWFDPQGTLLVTD